MAGAPPLFDRALGAARATRKRGAEANILTRTIAEELVERAMEARRHRGGVQRLDLADLPRPSVATLLHHVLRGTGLAGLAGSGDEFWQVNF